MCHRCFREPTIHTLAEWSAVLRLATEWSFHDIRALAITRLETLVTPVNRILLGRAYDVSGWLPQAYAELCQRKGCLTLDEVKLLHPEDIWLIVTVREESFRSDSVVPPDDIVRRVETMFGSLTSGNPRTTESLDSDSKGPSSPTEEERPAHTNSGHADDNGTTTEHESTASPLPKEVSFMKTAIVCVLACGMKHLYTSLPGCSCIVYDLHVFHI